MPLGVTKGAFITLVLEAWGHLIEISVHFTAEFEFHFFHTCLPSVNTQYSLNHTLVYCDVPFFSVSLYLVCTGRWRWPAGRWPHDDIRDRCVCCRWCVHCMLGTQPAVAAGNRPVFASTRVKFHCLLRSSVFIIYNTWCNIQRSWDSGWLFAWRHLPVLDTWKY